MFLQWVVLCKCLIPLAFFRARNLDLSTVFFCLQDQNLLRLHSSMKSMHSSTTGHLTCMHHLV